MANLLRTFAKELRPIVEGCVAHRDSLTTVFRYGGSTDRNVIRFLIGTLGSIGNAKSIEILTAIVDDQEFGKDAIKAIESIQTISTMSQ